MSRLAELARTHRIAAGETQAQYATRFGFETATAVSLWESGKRKVPPQVVEAMLLDDWITQTKQYEICGYCEGKGIVAKELTPRKETRHDTNTE